MAVTNVIFRCLLLLAVLVSPLAQADAMDDILKRGTLRVGIAEFVPWAMPAKNGGYVGHDVDLGNKIAKDMDVRAEFKVYEWKDIIPALEAGEVDMIAGGIVITPQRALRITFTQPVALSGAGMATNTHMTRDVENLEELNDPDIVIATVTDTFSEGVARSIFDKAEIHSHSNKDDAEKEILEGRAHAYISSLPAVQFLVVSNSDAIDLPLSEPIVGWAEALAVQKGEQELLNFLNAWITAHEADRWLDATREYWFESRDWTQEVKR
ncbi:MAG: transporter substrate-binding domain-containing protein [Woeseiaceae bacterium]|nr:transporter substrate-binding domain-containing protein [Woeseiaceae bacterium]